jgi:hypothetical protein
MLFVFREVIKNRPGPMLALKAAAMLAAGLGKLKLDIEGLVIIVGNYGSGKTEVAVNLAVHRKKAGVDVRLADLDLVNPYFRTREAKAQLARMAIDVLVPPPQYHAADLPILIPQVAGLIKAPSPLTILDVGGDDVGATVLASLADALRGKAMMMLQVVNPFRPFTETVAGCLRIRHAIEAASKLKINGLIGNANLIDETRVEDVYQGYEFVRRLAGESNLPLKFVAVAAELLEKVDPHDFECPILPIKRQLVPPWRKAASLD